MSIDRNKTTIRGLTKEARNAFMDDLVLTRGVVTCGNCVFIKNDRCGKYNAAPPISVVLHGCDNWEEDIPF